MADRPVLQHPFEWSIVLVVMAALVGTGKSYLSSLAPSLVITLIVIPHVRRERRRAAERERAEAADGLSVDGEGDAG